MVDYSQSILLTSNDYLHTIEEKTWKRDEAKVEVNRRKKVAAGRQELREIEKRQKDAERQGRAVDAVAKEIFCQQWSTDAIKEARQCLQHLFKNPPPLPPPGSQIAPFCGYLPSICKENMARRLAKQRCQNFETGDLSSIPVATPPVCVHCVDFCYIP